ncbi:MAG: YihY/virulence factor BrkB family protein [Terriglobia bacterium]
MRRIGWTAEFRKPLPGILRRVGHKASEDNVLVLAAAMSFFFALSIFPFLIFMAGLVGTLPSTGLWDHVLRWVTLYLPESSQTFVFKTVDTLMRGRKTFISIGFLSAAWSASGGLLSLMSSLNTAYEVKETRPLWMRMGVAFLMLFVLGFLFLGSFGILTVGHLFATWVNSHMAAGAALPLIWRVGHWVVSLLLLIVAMSIVDYLLPNLGRPWHWLTPGGVLALVAWVPGTLAFDFYVRYISSYSRLYGALASFMILMVWVYLVSLVILVGAEINCELRKLNAGDPGGASQAVQPPSSQVTGGD